MVKIQEQDLGSYIVVYFKDGNPAYVGKALTNEDRRELGDEVRDPSLLWLEPSLGADYFTAQASPVVSKLDKIDLAKVKEAGVKTIWSLDAVVGYSVLKVPDE